MTPETYLRAQLATLAWREAAHYGGIDNMLGVAYVMRNRVRAGWGDWARVLSTVYVVETYPYGWLVDSLEEHDAPLGGLNALALMGDVRDAQFRIVLEKIDDIYTGLATDSYTEGALYYGELAAELAPWFLENVVRQPEAHPRVATIGPVSFFR